MLKRRSQVEEEPWGGIHSIRKGCHHELSVTTGQRSSRAVLVFCTRHTVESVMVSVQSQAFPRDARCPCACLLKRLTVSALHGVGVVTPCNSFARASALANNVCPNARCMSSFFLFTSLSASCLVYLTSPSKIATSVCVHDSLQNSRCSLLRNCPACMLFLSFLSVCTLRIKTR